MRANVLFAVLLICKIAFSQGATSDHRSTSVPPGSRFEIVQSQLAAKWTFRLDKYTGRVYQLVKDSEEKTSWQAMDVDQLPKIANPIKPRFQIFTSGLAARHTFLLDIDSGATWLLVTGTKLDALGNEYENHSWEPFSK
jgi:hypothetical protein